MLPPMERALHPQFTQNIISMLNAQSTCLQPLSTNLNWAKKNSNVFKKLNTSAF